MMVHNKTGIFRSNMDITQTNISYQRETRLEAAEVAILYKLAGLNRPVEDLERMQAMLDHANLIVTARLETELVGIARALTDFRYCCYLSDLAVHEKFQGKGIGKELIDQVQEFIGPETKLILLSAPKAEAFYSHVGFEKADNAWVIPRKF